MDNIRVIFQYVANFLVTVDTSFIATTWYDRSLSYFSRIRKRSSDAVRSPPFTLLVLLARSQTWFLSSWRSILAILSQINSTDVPDVFSRAISCRPLRSVNFFNWILFLVAERKSFNQSSVIRSRKIQTCPWNHNIYKIYICALWLSQHALSSTLYHEGFPEDPSLGCLRRLRSAVC